jgi:NADPH:quinone reductase-like Zn-dependent oxidoreductase
MIALKVLENYHLELVDVPDPQPDQGHVRVKLKAAAINKRDYWISVGKYPSIVPGTTLGSDGAGIVDVVGAGVSKTLLDKAVIINPNVNWGDNPEVQGTDYKILGMPVDGTFAEYVIITADRLSELPNHLSFEEGAALPLAGLTAFRAVFRHGQVIEGKKVLISGFGGGVAHFAFLFARTVGADVSVTTGNQSNMDKARELGAEHQFNYNAEEWINQAAEKAGGFDVIIDSAGGDQFNNLIKLLNPGGRIVFYGASNGLPTSLDLYRLFWKQGTIQGSTMGNDQEFEAMIRFVEENMITPLISMKYPFEQADYAVRQVQHAGLPGKNVIVFK